MTDTYEKPRPVIDPGSEPFWSAAKQHRLSIPRCKACNQHHFYPRELCPHCHSDELEWTDASGRGEIYSYTIARKPAGPAFAADVPYVVAMIALDEGPRMLTNIITADVDSVRIGDRVRVKFDDVAADLTLPKFVLEKE
ncbi:Zn-ribbon domain-containing OB-fold protein [Bosea sp. (in: a-proteobacteria)]|uniref:Zn-ribbon domain-containing OB-fold protein n=1 Tax=Bosea sp. (in: a-proteobacteria) TaxID=1871050 RepID=UPI001ACB9C85|nr:Zn-ribbon domain-containing OB-fold protein [Bosea sp. (in: a-proteobacteria)]MBN9440464.1 Zn-ribbon domain-containing OB-fold protein [Bosea sp. (in: a-proteobacteria)]